MRPKWIEVAWRTSTRLPLSIVSFFLTRQPINYYLFSTPPPLPTYDVSLSYTSQHPKCPAPTRRIPWSRGPIQRIGKDLGYAGFDSRTQTIQFFNQFQFQSSPSLSNSIALFAFYLSIRLNLFSINDCLYIRLRSPNRLIHPANLFPVFDKQCGAFSWIQE